VPVGELREVTGILVVQVVAPRHQLPEERQVLVAVGVLEPVDEAGEEVGDEYAADALCDDEKHGTLRGAWRRLSTHPYPATTEPLAVGSSTTLIHSPC